MSSIERAEALFEDWLAEGHLAVIPVRCGNIEGADFSDNHFRGEQGGVSCAWVHSDELLRRMGFHAKALIYLRGSTNDFSSELSVQMRASLFAHVRSAAFIR